MPHDLPTPKPSPAPTRRQALASAVILTTTGFAAEPVRSQTRPAALKALEAHGFTIVGSFPSAGSLRAWAAYRGQQPLAVYETPDGKHLVVGTLLAADGQEPDRERLQRAVASPMGDGIWRRLGEARWIADGSERAPRIVYVFTDPNCPFCAKLWADARPWVDAGKAQLRHILVGILGPTSRGKSAALLAARDPAAALRDYESRQAGVVGQAMAQGGRPRPLGDETLKPLTDIPPAVGTQLDAHAALMAELGLQATPAVVWRQAQGLVQSRAGVPPDALVQVLGPR